MCRGPCGAGCPLPGDDVKYLIAVLAFVFAAVVTFFVAHFLLYAAFVAFCGGGGFTGGRPYIPDDRWVRLADWVIAIASGTASFGVGALAAFGGYERFSTRKGHSA